METTRRRKRTWRTAGIASGVLALCAGAVYVAVPALIRVAYAAEGAPLVERLMSGRDIHPVDRYLDAWREIAAVPMAIVAFAAVAAVVLALPRVESFLRRAFGSPAPVHPGTYLSRARLALIHGVIVGLAGGSALHIMTDSERWPFSNYPMYADLARPEIVSVRLFGVGEGEEIPLDRTVYVRPFDHVRLTDALRHISRDPDRSQEATTALAYVLSRYHTLRDAGAHAGPPLCGLRLYELRWEVRPGAPNRGTPDQRELLWEKLVDCPPEAEE